MKNKLTMAIDLEELFLRIHAARSHFSHLYLENCNFPLKNYCS